MEAYCREGWNPDESGSGQSSVVAFEASSGLTNLALPLGVAWVVAVGSLVMALAWNLASMEAEEVMIEVLVDVEECVLAVAYLEAVAEIENVAAEASVDSVAAAQWVEEMDEDLVATEAGQVEDQV